MYSRYERNEITVDSLKTQLKSEIPKINDTEIERNINKASLDKMSYSNFIKVLRKNSYSFNFDYNNNANNGNNTDNTDNTNNANYALAQPYNNSSNVNEIFNTNTNKTNNASICTDLNIINKDKDKKSTTVTFKNTSKLNKTFNNIYNLSSNNSIIYNNSNVNSNLQSIETTGCNTNNNTNTTKYYSHQKSKSNIFNSKNNTNIDNIKTNTNSNSNTYTTKDHSLPHFSNTMISNYNETTVKDNYKDLKKHKMQIQLRNYQDNIFPLFKKSFNMKLDKERRSNVKDTNTNNTSNIANINSASTRDTSNIDFSNIKSTKRLNKSLNTNTNTNSNISYANIKHKEEYITSYNTAYNTRRNSLKKANTKNNNNTTNRSITSSMISTNNTSLINNNPIKNGINNINLNTNSLTLNLNNSNNSSNKHKHSIRYSILNLNSNNNNNNSSSTTNNSKNKKHNRLLSSFEPVEEIFSSSSKPKYQDKHKKGFHKFSNTTITGSSDISFANKTYNKTFYNANGERTNPITNNGVYSTSTTNKQPLYKNCLAIERGIEGLSKNNINMEQFKSILSSNKVAVDDLHVSEYENNILYYNILYYTMSC